MSFLEPINFKNDEEKNLRIAAKVPQCMKDLPPETFSRQHLTDEELKAAKNDLINKEFIKLEYPKTMKFHVDPPIPLQQYGLISFIPSKGAKPDDDGCFGVLKSRGNFESEAAADNMSEDIIRRHDSYAIIDYIRVGRPFPLMLDNRLYRCATKEVDIRKKVDETIRNDLKKKRDQDRDDMEQVQERHRQLMADVSEEREKKYDDLEYYVTLKTKKASLRYHVDEMTRKMKESAELIKAASAELATLEEAHPEYKNQYMDRYTAALQGAGISIDSNPLIKYMKD
jgi:hypothetical protein